MCSLRLYIRIALVVVVVTSKVQAFFKNRSSIHLPFIFPNLMLNPGIDISAFSVGSVRNVR